MASHNTSTQVKEIDSVGLLKQFDETKAQSIAPTSGDATTASTGVQNSQVTIMNGGESPENRQRGQTTQEAINNSSPFNKNLNHINLVDNSLVTKLPRVEYEMDFGCFGYDNSTEETVDDTIMEGVHDDLYTMENRPGS